MGDLGAESGEGEATDRCPVGQVRIKGAGQSKKRAHVESGNHKKQTNTHSTTVHAGHPDGDGRRELTVGGVGGLGVMWIVLALMCLLLPTYLLRASEIFAEDNGVIHGTYSLRRRA